MMQAQCGSVLEARAQSRVPVPARCRFEVTSAGGIDTKISDPFPIGGIVDRDEEFEQPGVEVDLPAGAQIDDRMAGDFRGILVVRVATADHDHVGGDPRTAGAAPRNLAEQGMIR